MMHNIPVIILDDFLDNPDSWRELGTNCEYFTSEIGNWPGERSRPLPELDKNAFDLLTQKFFSVFYDERYEKLQWSIDARFQKIPAKYGEGWVHKDESKISGIVYLTPDSNIDSGTSLMQPKRFESSINQDVKQALFKDRIKPEQANQAREENNNQYIETIRIGNRYNRLVAFDGHIPHKANIYNSSDGERLTLVFFIDRFDATRTPIERVRRT